MIPAFGPPQAGSGEPFDAQGEHKALAENAEYDYMLAWESYHLLYVQNSGAR